MKTNDKILITGANGLVGTALQNELRAQGYTSLIPLSRDLCNLTHFDSVKTLFQQTRPQIVFHLAASVYGIGGNAKNKGAIFCDNVLMNTHVIEASRLVGVKKVIAMGTIAAYATPKEVPIKEEHIWQGPPHASESSYGHAKRAMLAQLEAYQDNYGLDFAYVISTNLYGPHDKFDTQLGHVIPSLIRKFYEAQGKQSHVSIWGDGSAARDFLYSKDMARALCLVMQKYTGAINVASGTKTLIREAVDLLTDYFAMHGKVQWEPSMPNGRTYYEIDRTKLHSLGFTPKYNFHDGLLETLEWFVGNYEKNLVRT